MSRNIMNIAKWLPTETDEHKLLFVDCGQLKQDTDLLVLQLVDFLNTLKLTHQLHMQTLEGIVDRAQTLVHQFQGMSFKMDLQSPLQNLKIRQTIDLLWRVKLKLTYLLQQLINETLTFYSDDTQQLLKFVFRLSNLINKLLVVDTKYSLNKKVSVANNNCASLLYPMRKISITRILQVLAQSRAENCCHRLIDCLLENYKASDTSHTGDMENSSDNSSIEIYRALTRHMTPPVEPKPAPAKKSGESVLVEPLATAADAENCEDDKLEDLDQLISNEENQVTNLLNVAMEIVPKMLGVDGVKKSKTTGELRVSVKASSKVMEYYEQILWGEVGNYLEHVVLWWGAGPLAARAPHSSQHLRDWILQFTPTAPIPQVIIAALHSLADALGCHVTSTSWDQHFRLALVAAYRPNNPDTGKLFAEMLQDLVMLSNQCEVTNEWIVGAPLDELPLVEQIPVLHRLDHSVHTTRLWAASETRKLANSWHVDSFFTITQSDIAICVSQLGDVRFADRSAEIAKGGLGVHVQVCANMREKLVSEVKVNVDKLKLVPKECLEVLAKICQTVSLANMQMVFPGYKHWRRVSEELPRAPSSYVVTYLDRVLLPVLEATNDHSTSNMVLRIMCEAWLDHIYMHRIKFTRFGALQLLTDFASVADWLLNCAIITQDVRKHMLRNEVLRRCEGVGRLLLRSPGEPIDMGKKDKAADGAGEGADGHDSSTESAGPETMPAEMYVPNQEQWLELRAVRKKSMFLPSICCGLDS